MRTFFKKTAILAALVLGTLCAVYVLPIPSKHFLSAILNKRDLLKDNRQNRIIFVGGSGLYCGLDSEMISKSFNRPVVNMGLYFGFGITPLLREIEPYLRAGDTIVVVPEYSVVFDRYDDEARKWLFALAPARNITDVYRGSPGVLKTFALDMGGLLKSKFESFPVIARDLMHRRHETAFVQGYVTYGKEFNAEGDSLHGFPVSPWPKGKGENLFAAKGYRDQPLDALNAFCRDARMHGIAMYFVFPAYAEEDYRRQQPQMLEFEHRLHRDLDCPILGTAQDFIYPYRFFSDSINHLTPEGKRKRTEKLIGLLGTAMGRQAAGRNGRS